MLPLSSNLGFAYDRLGTLPQSIEALQEDSKTKTRRRSCLQQSGRQSLQRQEGVIQRPSRLFMSSISLKPGDAEALNNLGAAYYITEDYPKALDTFLKAVAANPTSPTLDTTSVTLTT